MADIQLNSVTLATESGGTVTLDNGVQDNITRLGTVATGNISHADIVYPAGHVLQVNGTHNDYDWGSVSDATQTYCDWIDVVLTTKGANSRFVVMGKLAMTDTGNSACGVGIGFRYTPTGGSQVTVTQEHQHETYEGNAGDHYMCTSSSFVLIHQ